MESMRIVRSRNVCEIAAAFGYGMEAINDAVRLQSISSMLHKLDENDCNYGLTVRQESRQTNLEKEANAIAIKHGMTAYHQGDPRGWSLYIMRKDDKQYTDGIGVCPH